MDQSQNAKSIEKLQEGIQAILVAIGKMEVEMRQFSGVATEVKAMSRDLIEVMSSVKSVHKRVDAMEEREKESKSDKKWLIGTVIGFVGIGWKLLEVFSGKG